MKLYSLIIICLYFFHINAAQEEDKKYETDLLEALKCADQGEFLICRYNEKRIVTALCHKLINQLRKNDERKICDCEVDYVVVGSQMSLGHPDNPDNREVYMRNIPELVEFSLSKHGYERGLIVYNITDGCKIWVKESFADEINRLRNSGWKVLVNACNNCIPSDFEKNFSGIKTVILSEEVKPYFFTNGLLIMAACIVFGILFDKFMQYLKN